MQGTTLTETDNIQNNTDIDTPDEQSLIDRIFNAITGVIGNLTELPEPEEPAQINIQTTELQQYTQEITNAQVQTNLTELKIDEQIIQTTSPVTLVNYTGTLELNRENMTLEGEAKKATNDEITIENLQIQQTTPKQDLQIINQGKTSFSFANATADIQTNTTDIETSNDILEINSFKGNQTIQPSENRTSLNGYIHTITTRELTIN